MSSKKVCPLCFQCNHFHICCDTGRIVGCSETEFCLDSGFCNPSCCSRISCYRPEKLKKEKGDKNE